MQSASNLDLHSQDRLLRECTFNELYSKLKIFDDKRVYWSGKHVSNSDAEIFTCFEPLVEQVEKGFNATRFRHIRTTRALAAYQEGENVYLCLKGTRATDIQESLVIRVYLSDQEIMTVNSQDVFIADWRTPHHRVKLGDVRLPQYSIVNTEFVYMTPISADLIPKLASITSKLESVDLMLDNSIRKNLVKGRISNTLKIDRGNLQFFTTRPECHTHIIYFLYEMMLDCYKIYTDVEIYDLEGRKMEFSVFKTQENYAVSSHALKFPLEFKSGCWDLHQIQMSDNSVYKAVVKFSLRPHTDLTS